MARYSAELLSKKAGGIPVEPGANTLLLSVIANERSHPSGLTRTGQLVMAGSERFLNGLVIDSGLAAVFSRVNVSRAQVEQVIAASIDRWKKNDPDTRMRILKGYPDDLTGGLSEVLFKGAAEAMTASASAIKLEHLALGLMKEDKSRARDVLRELQVNDSDLRQAIEDKLAATIAPVVPAAPVAAPTPAIVTATPTGAATPASPEAPLSPAVQAAVNVLVLRAVDQSLTQDERDAAIDAIQKLSPTPPPARRRAARVRTVGSPPPP